MDGTPVHNILIDERRNTERLNGTERNDIQTLRSEIAGYEQIPFFSDSAGWRRLLVSCYTVHFNVDTLLTKLNIGTHRHLDDTTSLSDTEKTHRTNVLVLSLTPKLAFQPNFLS